MKKFGNYIKDDNANTFTLKQGTSSSLITLENVIEEFIKSEFERFVPESELDTIKKVNVICGDTNMTVEKSKVKFEVKTGSSIETIKVDKVERNTCLLYTSPSPRD